MFKLFKKKKIEISRSESLLAKPVPAPTAICEDMPDDGLRVKIPTARASSWKAKATGDGTIWRQFELDSFGREVYKACDGKSSVKSIIRSFAATHEISIPEAELSVAKFINMLMQRGIIIMDIKKTKDR